MHKKVKEKIKRIKKTYKIRSTVVKFRLLINVDVFSIQSDEKTGFVNYIACSNTGCYYSAHT